MLVSFVTLFAVISINVSVISFTGTSNSDQIVTYYNVMSIIVSVMSPAVFFKFSAPDRSGSALSACDLNFTAESA